MRRWFAGLVLGTVLLGCSTRGFDRKLATENLTKQAEQVGQAMLKEDHAALAKLTHPAMIRAMGGKDEFISRVAGIAAETKDQGIRFLRITYSDPSELVESSGEIYAIVPFQLAIKVPNDSEGVQPSYLIAVSADRGQKWTFLDGSGVGDDRNRLHQLLPNFPKKLNLPTKQDPLFPK